MSGIKVNQGEMNRTPSPMTDSNVQRYGSADADDINAFDAIMNSGTAGEQVEGMSKKSTKDKGDSASTMSSDHEEVASSHLFGGANLTTDKSTIGTFETVMNKAIVGEQVEGMSKKLAKDKDDHGRASESVSLAIDRPNTEAVELVIKNDSVSEHTEGVSKKSSQEVNHNVGATTGSVSEEKTDDLLQLFEKPVLPEAVEGKIERSVSKSESIGPVLSDALSGQDNATMPVSGFHDKHLENAPQEKAVISAEGSQVIPEKPTSENEVIGLVSSDEGSNTPTRGTVRPEGTDAPERQNFGDTNLKEEKITPPNQKITEQEPETLTIGREEIVVQPEEIVSNYAEQVLSNLTSLSDSRMVVAADRISNIGTAIIERLMVTEAALAAKQEVTIVFKENILPGTQVSITRDGTALSLSFVSVNPNSLEFLQAGQESLRNFLMDRVDRVSNVHIKFEGQHEANDLAQPRQQRRQQQDEPSHEER